MVSPSQQRRAAHPHAAAGPGTGDGRPEVSDAPGRCSESWGPSRGEASRDSLEEGGKPELPGARPRNQQSFLARRKVERVSLQSLLSFENLSAGAG